MKKVLITIVVVFVLIQMIRPKKNDSRNDINHIATKMEVPEDVALILKKSCNDCHSNFTNYPWYSEIAPVSWYLSSHVNDGKEHLNFSEWSTYNKFQKEHIVKDLEEVLNSHEMPLKSYLLMHSEATLSAVEYASLLNWAKTIKVE